MNIQRSVITILLPLLISYFFIFFHELEDLMQLELEQLQKSKLELCLEGKKTEQIQLIGLGDSLTVGIGDERNLDGYFGRLISYLKENNCTISSKNFSIKGYKTDDLLEQLTEENVREAIKQTDVIIFTIGGNDLVSVLKEVTLSLQFDLIEKAQKSYANNIEKVLTEIREINKDAEIYYIGLYNPITDIFGNEHISSLVTKWNKISEEKVQNINGAHFIAIDNLFKHEPSRFLSNDKFHPNDLGYEVIMQRVVSYMLEENE